MRRQAELFGTRFGTQAYMTNIVLLPYVPILRCATCGWLYAYQKTLIFETHSHDGTNSN